LILVRPLSLLSVCITEKCNLACKHCGALQFREKTRLPSFPELSRSEFRSLFREARRRGCRSVILSGGEPLLRPDAWEIFRDVDDLGLSFSLFTNGTLLNNDAIRRLRGYENLDHVRLSLDYIRDSDVERLRGTKRGASTALKTIESLTNSGISVGVGMILLGDNFTHIKGLAQALQKRGARYLRAVPCIPIGNAAGRSIPREFFVKSLCAVLEAKKAFEGGPSGAPHASGNLRNGFENLLVHCGGGENAVSISAHGQVSFCPCVDMQGTGGTIRDMPLSELAAIAGKKKKAWQRTIRKRSPECGSCGSYALCRGGCIAEWHARRNTPMRSQPFCMKALWPAAIKKMRIDAPLRRVVAATLFQLKMHALFTGERIFCHRELPIWSIRL
jgi:radical SAM protein with 4Fe4S-binding SPASM domain